MKKSFKLTHKPGQVLLPPAARVPSAPETAANDVPVGDALAPETSRTRGQGRSIVSDHRSPAVIREEMPAPQKKGVTTRKTIEVPEEYFFQVKMQALQRRIKEKDMWAEILEEYFLRHPG